MTDHTDYWREISDYDIEAEAILKSKRYFYVGFMSHQSVENVYNVSFGLWRNIP